MAKFLKSGKWKKRTLTALSVVMAATMTCGILSACAEPQPEPEEESKVAPTDVQLIKNGNFEFYSDQLVDDDENGKPSKKLNVISSPDSWTFTPGSPSSNATSGVVNADEWAYFARTGGYLFSTYTKGEGDDAEEVTTFSGIDEAVAHWKDANVSAYDRLKFLDIYKTEIAALDAQSDAAKLFAEYNYSIDFEDVEKLDEEVRTGSAGGLTVHPGAKADETSMLMIHNQRTADDGIRGTAQYYTSSTTVTLSAGTAAEVSVWVRTDALYHYKDTELNARGGAYIGVTNTVGGTSLDQMQIYNIHTNGEWKQYTVLVRASTFATTTFRIVLGLGQGSSDDKYYAVDGYAFFDDLECTVMAATDYEEKAGKEGVTECKIDDLKEDKLFDMDDASYGDTFALDLYAGFDPGDGILNNIEFGLTEETSGSKTYDSGIIAPSRGDDEKNIVRNMTYADIAGTGDGFLKKIYEHDFKDKFPFGGDEPNREPVVMLMSQNGAAYTAKISSSEFTLAPDSRILISFFAKTSEIQSGLTGAGASIVDAETKLPVSTITSFDTTKISGVDIDSKSDDPAMKDIYRGWAQCFFFVENDTDEEQTFTLELTYGPTTIIGTNEFSYGDGYAAFTHFELKPLTSTEYSYATTGDLAKKASLTGGVEESKNFDSLSATAEKDIEKGPALPANFIGVKGGSNYVNPNGEPNEKPEKVYAGLLNEKYAQKYFENESAWKDVLGVSAATDGDGWWEEQFSNARQPLVILNAEEAAYGYFADEAATVSASSYSRISMRVKASTNATAHIYLTDMSSAEKAGSLIYPNLPTYTYWYDDDGNIVDSDPTAKDFDQKDHILYTLQPNGLYQKAGATDGAFYANLSNYQKDSVGNLVTRDGKTIAFYAHENKFFAYYDEETDSYTTEVKDLAEDKTLPLRYDYSDTSLLKGTEIVVKGTGEWITVSFYIHTGNEAKSYRLEVWSGDRKGDEPNPAGSYVFFDNYTTEDVSSDYSTWLEEDVAKLKDEINEKNGVKLGDEGYLGKKDNLPKEYASYYTFTFYDADTYLRYDETTDEDELGNPYSEYTQSSNSEQLVTLYYEDKTEGQTESYSYFLDYAAIDVTVEAHYPETDSDETTDDTDAEAATTGENNIWLLLSSGLLAIVLLAVIILVIVRRIVKKVGKSSRVKPVKYKRVKPGKGNGAASEE